jgi:hypothetical protein
MLAGTFTHALTALVRIGLFYWCWGCNFDAHGVVSTGSGAVPGVAAYRGRPQEMGCQDCQGTGIKGFKLENYSGD